MIFNVQHTTAGWRYDILKGLKVLDKQVIAAFCKMLKTGVGHGLSATGLL
jgi:hypothetical protein